MAAGIIDPTKVSLEFCKVSQNGLKLHFLYIHFQVVRCCLEHAASVAKTFLTSDVVVVDIKEPESAAAASPMDNSGENWLLSFFFSRFPLLWKY